MWIKSAVALQRLKRRSWSSGPLLTDDTATEKPQKSDMRKHFALSAHWCLSPRRPPTVNDAAPVVAVKAIHAYHCLCPRMPSDPGTRDPLFLGFSQSEGFQLLSRDFTTNYVCFGSFMLGTVSAVRRSAAT